MRNWITDKFGRNRVRTPRAQPSPVPRPAPVPTQQTVYTTGSGIQYWYYDEIVNNTFTYSGIDRSQWTEIWGTVDPAPQYPEKLRLPEGV